MYIPKEFEINGSLWRVEYKWNLTYKKRKIDGLCEPSTRTIYIDRALSREDKWITFRHEWRHALWHEYDVGHNSSDPKKRLTTDQEEDLQAAIDAEEDSVFTIRWKKRKA